MIQCTRPPPPVHVQVKTMARLDPLTLTEPCYQPTGGSALTPLAYLRSNLRRRSRPQAREEEGERGGGTRRGEEEVNNDDDGDAHSHFHLHEHAQDMVPLLEGLLLQQGHVPLADGTAIPVGLHSVMCYVCSLALVLVDVMAMIKFDANNIRNTTLAPSCFMVYCYLALFRSYYQYFDVHMSTLAGATSRHSAADAEAARA